MTRQRLAGTKIAVARKKRWAKGEEISGKPDVRSESIRVGGVFRGNARCSAVSVGEQRLRNSTMAWWVVESGQAGAQRAAPLQRREAGLKSGTYTGFGEAKSGC